MRRTCPGSQQEPARGEVVRVAGRANPRGTCRRCLGVYALRKDGTLLAHRLL